MGLRVAGRIGQEHVSLAPVCYRREGFSFGLAVYAARTLVFALTAFLLCLYAAMVGAAAKPPATPQPPPGNKPRPTAPQREPGAGGRKPGRLPLWLRVGISVLIVWHFTAVYLAALSVPASSRLVYRIAQEPPMQWYLDALYLNQGHSFFAPDVGPGHLIRFELFDQSGRVIEQGEIPNRKEHWPRLRYHRHFMLADQAGIGSDNKEYQDYWQRRYLENYARHLLRIREDVAAARVVRLAHWPIPRDLALQGRKLTDPEGYEALLEVTQRRSDLGPSDNEQVGAERNTRIDVTDRRMGVPR